MMSGPYLWTDDEGILAEHFAGASWVFLIAALLAVMMRSF
jgi:hypothetical protein